MNRKQGSIALEMLSSGFIALSCCVGISTLSMIFFLKQLLHVETYFLARSQLYNNTRACAPRNSLWPNFTNMKVLYACDVPGAVSGKILYKGLEFLRAQINLSGQ